MKTRAKIGAMVLAGLSAGTVLAANGGSGNNAWSAPYRVRLTGAQQVPPVTDTPTRSTAVFRFRRDYSQLRFSMPVRRAQYVTEAHLHCAPPGVEGPPIVSLFGLGGPAAAPVFSLIQGGYLGNLDIAATVDNAGVIRYDLGGPTVAALGCRSTIGRDITNLRELAEAIAANQIYVNLHSVSHPLGLLRAQLPASNRGQGGNAGAGGQGTGGTGGQGGTGTVYGGTGGPGGQGSSGTGGTGTGSDPGGTGSSGTGTGGMGSPGSVGGNAGK
jgi:hypothetical protein